jgi:hypothetical protein
MWARLWQGVVAREAPLQCFPQRGQLRPQAAPGELGQQVGVVGARDERLEHGPAGDREHLRGDRAELDAGVLEGLVEPLHLARALLNLGLAVKGQVTQLADLPGRHETRAHQPVLEQLADPLGVAHVRLAARDVAQLLGVQKPALPVVLEQVVDRPPVDAARLHPDELDPRSS